MKHPSDRFTQRDISTIAKRAGHRCSNPDCGAPTAGPTRDPTRSINIGEAAHIYGAKAGSARFDPHMPTSARSDITNAIWLCTNCHTKVDADPARYPAGLLFEWQKRHEVMVEDELGKPGTAIRNRYEARFMEEFGRISYLAERIIHEKGENWEYRLISEILRSEMIPVNRRWRALAHDLYVLPNIRLNKEETPAWFSDLISEIKQITNACSQLFNNEFERACGKPGTPGDEKEIVFVSRLFAEMCQAALRWEEKVRFTIVSEQFENLKALFAGRGGDLIDEAGKLPEKLSEILAGQRKKGVHVLEFRFSLPIGWSEEVIEEMQIAYSDLQPGH